MAGLGPGRPGDLGRRGRALRPARRPTPQALSALGRAPAAPRRRLFLEMKCLVQGCVHRC